MWHCFNGLALHKFTVTPIDHDIFDDVSNEINRIDKFNYNFVVKSLNTLFDNLIGWIEMLPDITVPEVDCRYISPGVIYNDGTIRLCQEIRRRYDGKLDGEYYDVQHLSYYKYDRQEPYFLDKEKDYNDFPAINSFYGFTTLESERLFNFSSVKYLSEQSYDLLVNAYENGIHWIFRSIQAFNHDSPVI